MKKVLLVLAIAFSFLLGYAGYVKAAAFPFMGRDEYYGYFHNRYDDQGTFVFAEGIPTSVNTANEFINYVEKRLAQGPNAQDGIGAAFIIQTMLGGTSRDNTPSAAQIADWESRVRYAASNGWIRWNTTVSYQMNSYYQGTNRDDDAFYDHGVTETASGIEFTDGNKIVYQLKHKCANPVGKIGALKKGASYDITGTSSVSDTTVIPGQTVTFTHKLKNSGPDSAPGVRYTVYHNGATKATGGPFTLGVTTTTVNTNSFKIPNNALPGTKYCQYVHFTPKDENGGSGNSAQACATVIADFSLTPTVTASASAVQQNDTVTFTYKVFNPGPTPSTLTSCKIVGNNHGPGYTPLPQQDVDRTSDPGYNPPATTCPTNFLVNVTTTVATETVSVGNLAPGSRLCRSLVVDPKSQAGGPRASAEACVVIAKTPYVHFLGNDVWAGGGFASVSPACNTSAKITTSSHTLQNGTNAGSAVEYAAFALGKITNFGSASKSLVNPASAVGKMLTFSNVNSSNLGFYGAPQHCINDYISTYSGTPVTAEPTTIDVGGRPSGKWQVNGAHTFHGTMPAGSQQIYLVNGDVTIDGDIKYPANYLQFGDVPSLVIIATGNILIQDNVGQMDGLYVTRSTFNTCSNAPAGNLSVSTCNQQLTINGSVIAGTLSLLRTYGADGSNDTDRKKPAEVFNFNAEMYLKSALSGSNTSTLQIVDEKDLPPRY